MENYDLLMQKVIAEIDGRGDKPKLLLNSCCGPCSTSVLERLMQHFEVTVHFYNPNLNSSDEYEKRFMAQKAAIEGCGLTSVSIEADGWQPEEWQDHTRNHPFVNEGGPRCKRCIAYRLEQTAVKAARDGYEWFTTTLSVSSHKDSQWINQCGALLEAKYSVRWLPSDFKKRGGYQRSIALSRQMNLYRQDYCGCTESYEAALKRHKGGNR